MDLTRHWQEYVEFVNKQNEDMEKQLDLELKNELFKLQNRPWWKKLFFTNEGMWLELAYARKAYNRWREVSVEDYLTWWVNERKV